MFTRRTFMTSVAAGMGGVALGSLPKVPDTSSRDRLLGMFVMGAYGDCLLYTSPSPRDQRGSRMPSSA